MGRQTQESVTSPPRLAITLVHLSTEPATREAVLGDLQEGYHRHAREDLRGARAWYWREALSSVTPLLRRRVHSSAIGSLVLIAACTMLAFTGIYVWEHAVARKAAQAFAASYEAAPLVAARLVFVAAQMVSIAVLTTGVALLTFRTDESFLANIARRLSPLAALIIAPPVIESLFLRTGYALSFVAPWIMAMAAALWLGARAGERLVLATR